MATTTNFGWETPDDTDLVKDGAAAIRTALNGVDTSFVDLKGGTTGQVLAKASGTDLDFTWVAQDDSNAIQNAIVDAKGDLIAATAADTPARLAVGTNGQVLTADSTASTGIKWADPAAGGMTLLSTTTLSGSSTSISPISGSYTDLKIVIYGTTNASSNYYPYLKPNGSSGIATWYYGINANGSAVQQAQLAQDFAMNYNTRAQSNANNVFTITINNYSSTAITKKTFTGAGTQVGSTGNVETFEFGGFFDISGAITSLVVSASAGSYNAGTVLVYGVK